MTAAVSTERPGPAAATARILVADDSATNVFVLTAMLRSLGHAAFSAADGAEAVRLAVERYPALIFMDVQMPRLDGVSAAIRIREAFGSRSVAIIAVTAHPEIRHQPGFKAARFDDFMVKPVELSLVRQAVGRWMPEDIPQDGGSVDDPRGGRGKT